MDLLVFILLPALAFCSITVNIQTFENSTEPLIQIQGNDTEFISENEISTFRITDEVLKNAVKNISGIKPAKVFLVRNDSERLYDRFSWEQVKRILVPVKSEILTVQTEKYVLDAKEFIDNINLSNMLGLVLHSLETKWLTNNSFDVKKPMAYSVNGSIEISFTSPWGTNAVRSKGYILVAVEHFYGSGALLATMYTDKITVTVLVEYTARLTGKVACMYESSSRKENYDINVLLRAAGYSTTVKSVGIIKIRLHTNGEVAVTSRPTKRVLEIYPLTPAKFA